MRRPPRCEVVSYGLRLRARDAGPAAAEEVGVDEAEARVQWGQRTPAVGMHPGRIEQLARRAVGFRGIEAQLAFEPDDTRDGFREPAYRHVLPVSDVDQLADLARVVPLHEQHAGFGHVVAV